MNIIEAITYMEQSSVPPKPVTYRSERISFLDLHSRILTAKSASEKADLIKLFKKAAQQWIMSDGYTFNYAGSVRAAEAVFVWVETGKNKQTSKMEEGQHSLLTQHSYGAM